MLTAGFSKAYSSLAFVACPPELKRLLLEKLGAFTLNRSGFPIVEVPLADADDLAKAGRFLLDQGIYVTLAFDPGLPREEVGFRIQVTAANTDDEVTELLIALDRLADVVPLRSTSTGTGPRRSGLFRQDRGTVRFGERGGRCTDSPGWTGTDSTHRWPGARPAPPARPGPSPPRPRSGVSSRWSRCSWACMG